MPSDPSDREYVRAWTEMLTSFLARATSQKQSFSSFDEFLAAVEANKIKHHAEDWLPKSLADAAADRAKADAERLGLKWSLGAGVKYPTVVCEFPDRSKLIGRFTLNGPRVGKIVVEDKKR
jgi:hypothetical protein